MGLNQPPSAALLHATIAQVAPLIFQADNVGVSDDWRDLYYLLDYLSFAVDRAYPEIPCSKGCDHCCRKQLFRVTALEWETLRRGLAALPSETREAILQDNRRQFEPSRAALETMADAWSRGESPPQEAYEAAPTVCPMLLSGRCAAYAHRPAICRGYGYFSAAIASEPSLLICREEGPAWIRKLEGEHVETLPMPNWNPVQRRLETLNEGGSIKPLPLWLLESDSPYGSRATH